MNKIELEGIVVWEQSNIIYCKVKKDFNLTTLSTQRIHNFINGVKLVSKGKYLPLLINLTEIDSYRVVKMFQFFSPCAPVDLSVRSRSFIVKSFFTRIALSLFCIVTGNAFWDSIYDDRDKATGFCNRSQIIKIE